MARKKIVAGNWKMNMTPSQAVALVEELKPLVVSDDVEVVYCVPAIDIVPVVNAVKGTNVAVGAENMYFETKGAYTGEISADMLVDAGCKYVILGHSERRAMGETNADVNAKVLAALDNGLIPIMCVGESLEQREAGITEEWITMQIKTGLASIGEDKIRKMIIAYEPIWAIGTGKTATPEQAEEVCEHIRAVIRKLYGAKVCAPDLRGGTGLVAAALCADGKTEISGVNHIDRGYEDIENVLADAGADIKRINTYGL